MHTVFHFFHLALLVLVFLVRGRLLWLHSTAQEINVGLLVHLSSAHPSGNMCAVATHHQPSSLDAQVGTPAASRLLFPHLKQVDDGAESHRRGGEWSQLSPKRDDSEKKGVSLSSPTERNFDFMVLIIFLRNHSRIKHKDAEIVLLSGAPQRASLVKKTTRSPPSISFFLTSLFTNQYSSLTERQRGAWKQFNAFIEAHL